jgi:hypothetical protein
MSVVVEHSLSISAALLDTSFSFVCNVEQVLSENVNTADLQFSQAWRALLDTLGFVTEAMIPTQCSVSDN